MIKICKDDSEDKYGEALWNPIDFLLPFKRVRRVTRSNIHKLLNKDKKHATICRIIKQHMKPKRDDDDPYTISLFDTCWNCVRCGEKQELNLMIDDSLFAESTEPWSDWRDYCKVVDISSLKADIPDRL